MKKTLVAVAALAAFAGAHADVAITGLIEAGIAIPNTGANYMGSGGNGGSEITFTANDDLGSGLKATGSVTIVNNPFANSDSAGTVATGYSAAGTATNVIRTYNSFVGLSGEFGSLKLGSQFSPAFSAANIADPFGQANGTFNLAGAGQHTYGSYNYASPSIGGATIAYQGTADNSYSGYSVTYAAGAFTGAIAADTKDSTGVTTTVVAASYDMGVAKLSAGSTTATGGVKPATVLGVQAPVGPVVLVYSASAKSGSSNNQNMGLIYPMSKKTNLVAVNFNGGSSATRGNFIGIRTTF